MDEEKYRDGEREIDRQINEVDRVYQKRKDDYGFVNFGSKLLGIGIGLVITFGSCVKGCVNSLEGVELAQKNKVLSQYFGAKKSLSKINSEIARANGFKLDYVPSNIIQFAHDAQRERISALEKVAEELESDFQELEETFAVKEYKEAQNRNKDRISTGMISGIAIALGSCLVEPIYSLWNNRDRKKKLKKLNRLRDSLRNKKED